MNCTQARGLLEAGVDGELDLVRQVELDGHVRGCADCARRQAVLAAQRSALREKLPRFGASAALQARIRGALGGAARRDAGTVVSEQTSAAPDPSRVIRPAWRVAAMAASVAIAGLAGYAIGGERARTDILRDEVVTSHLRSLMPGHLMDVVSTDRHTVKPWFAGRVDFSPPVVDLAAGGFPLLGGRLDHLDGHDAAALIYGRRRHIINVYVWSTRAGAVRTGESSLDGYHGLAWTSGGLAFYAISDIPSAELADFALLFQAQDH